VPRLGGDSQAVYRLEFHLDGYQFPDEAYDGTAARCEAIVPEATPERKWSAVWTC